ncbi:MAG TPA: glycosyltransferase family 2 protein [Candidatus Saccharimonadia bacterium]|nr:glycosyltransferase family 2 protein [Candidatus Saccharimonadia bacterium]
MSEYEQLRVAIVIPAYNEGRSIGGVVAEMHKELSKTKYRYEVVVVDDGSKDDTATLALQAGARVIRHILNTGSGGATATGLSYAQQSGFGVAATIDADGQHEAIDLAKGLEKIRDGEADLLIGSRLMSSSGMSHIKVLGNRGLSTITNLLFGVTVTDSQSGLRIFSKKALDRLKWKTSGYEFCSEMLWRAKQQGLVIREYPIKAIYTDYSTSKGQNNWNGFNIVIALVSRRIMELFE